MYDLFSKLCEPWPYLDLGGGGESGHADFKSRYLMNDGYSYDFKIERLFLEIHCQNGQKKRWKNIG